MTNKFIKTHYQKITNTGIEYYKVGALNVVQSNIETPFSRAVIKHSDFSKGKFSISKEIYNSNRLNTVMFIANSHLSSNLDTFEIQFSTSQKSSIDDFSISLFSDNERVSDYHLSDINRLGAYSKKYSVTGYIQDSNVGHITAQVTYVGTNTITTNEIIYYDLIGPHNITLDLESNEMVTNINIKFEDDTDIPCIVKLFINGNIENEITDQKRNEGTLFYIENLQEYTEYTLHAQVEDPLGRIGDYITTIHTLDISPPYAQIDNIFLTEPNNIHFDIIVNDDFSNISNIHYFVTDISSHIDSIDSIKSNVNSVFYINSKHHRSSRFLNQFIDDNGHLKPIDEFNYYSIWLYVEDSSGIHLFSNSERIDIIQSSPRLFANVSEGSDGVSIHFHGNVEHNYNTNLLYNVNGVTTHLGNNKYFDFNVPVNFTANYSYYIFVEDRNHNSDNLQGNISLNHISELSFLAYSHYLTLHYSMSKYNDDIVINVINETRKTSINHEFINSNIIFTDPHHSISPEDNITINVQYKSQSAYTFNSHNIVYDRLPPYNANIEVYDKFLYINFNDDTSIESNVTIGNITNYSINHRSSFDMSHLLERVPYIISANIQDPYGRITNITDTIVLDDITKPLISDVIVNYLHHSKDFQIEANVFESGSDFKVAIGLFVDESEECNIQSMNYHIYHENSNDNIHVSKTINKAWSETSLSYRNIYPKIDNKYIIVIVVKETNNPNGNLSSIVYNYFDFGNINNNVELLHNHINPTKDYFEISGSLHGNGNIISNWCVDCFENSLNHDTLMHYFRNHHSLIPNSTMYLHYRQIFHNFANIDLSQDYNSMTKTLYVSQDEIIFRSNIDSRSTIYFYLYTIDHNNNETVFDFNSLGYHVLRSRYPFILDFNLRFINQTIENNTFTTYEYQSIEGYYPLQYYRTSIRDIEFKFNESKDVMYLIDSNIDFVYKGSHLPTRIYSNTYSTVSYNDFNIPVDISSFKYYRKIN